MWKCDVLSPCAEPVEVCRRVQMFKRLVLGFGEAGCPKCMMNGCAGLVLNRSAFRNNFYFRLLFIPYRECSKSKPWFWPIALKASFIIDTYVQVASKDQRLVNNKTSLIFATFFCAVLWENGLRTLILLIYLNLYPTKLLN